MAVRKNSRRKGKVGERQAAQFIRDLFGWGTGARRTQQYKGTTDSSDIEVPATPGAFWEIKREEHLSVHVALDRAVQEAGSKVAILMHRRNRTPWAITIRAEDLVRLADVVKKAEESGGVAATALPGDDAGGGAHVPHD